MNIVKIKCVWGVYFHEPFERTLEVSDDMTLGELHDEIQRLTGFDNDHLYTFFIGRSHHGRREELVDTLSFKSAAKFFYRTPLNEVFPLPTNMKLYYRFDFGDDWIFRITFRGQPKPDEKGKKYPQLIREVGPKPEQYPSWEE